VLGLARIAELGLFAAAAITAAVVFLGVVVFEMNMVIGMSVTTIAIMLSGAVLAFVLLRHQEKAAASALLLAAAFVVAISLLMQQYTAIVLIFIALCWLATLVVASVLLNTVSLKKAMLAAVPVAVLIGVVANFFNAELLLLWQKLLVETFSVFSAEEMAKIGDEKLDVINELVPEVLTKSITRWALMIVICAVFIARYWQAQLFNNGGFQKEFHSLRLGREAVIVFVAAFGLAQVFSGPFFEFVASAMLFVFFIQGLSVLHCLTKQRGLSKSWLTGMYAILWVPPTVLVLSVLGIADNLFRIREI